MSGSIEDAEAQQTSPVGEFSRLVTQLVGQEVAPVATALAAFTEGEEVLALVGFDIPVDDRPEHASGVRIGTPAIATALSLRFERMKAQIELHPQANLLFAAFDVSQSSPWVETMRGVAEFLRSENGQPRRAVLAISQESLTSARHQEFRKVLSEQLVTHIVFAKNPGGLSSAPQVLIRCEPIANSVQPRVQVASLSRDVRSGRRLADELANTSSGKRPERGAFRLSPLPAPESPWDLAHLDGERADLMDQAAEARGVRRLDDVVEVVMARPQQARDTAGLAGGEPLLTAGLIRDRLPRLSELALKTVGERATRIAAGDVVGRTLAPQHWAVADQELHGVAVGTGVILLRNKGLVSPGLLAAYLKSSTAQRLNIPVGSAMQQLRRQDLVAVPVPDLAAIEQTAGSESLREIDQAIDELDGLISGLKQRRDQAFRSFDQALVGQELQEAADEARLVKSQLQRQQEVARAFQDVYPYPVARALRQFRQQQEPLAQHAAVIRLIESILVTLGSTAAAWAHAAEATAVDVHQLGELANKWKSGGPSLGHWLGAIDGVGRLARSRGVDAYGLADATRRLKGGRGLLSDLAELVTWRNSTAHGGAPRSGIEARNSVEAILNTMNSALEGAALLAETQWLLVERADWQRKGNSFAVQARSLTGDHPDFEWTEFVSSVPRASGVVYLRHEQTESCVAMSPFVSVDVCEACSVEEIYYVDRITDIRGGLRSFTTGHKREAGALRDEILDCFPVPELKTSNT
ncbi:hypothetical protein [Nocardioides plantarum]|uniref:Uncharacterized protein n=1 Tax=Nocardioides plantarum TaxID=29299 RepID=A0ABV5KEE8_9ACTN|nr:hypothetical protein [Nocardioides plantarum]